MAILPELVPTRKPEIDGANNAKDTQGTQDANDANDANALGTRPLMPGANMAFTLALLARSGPTRAGKAGRNKQSVPKSPVFLRLL